jgi:hypothetical protein
MISLIVMIFVSRYGVEAPSNFRNSGDGSPRDFSLLPISSAPPALPPKPRPPVATTIPTITIPTPIVIRASFFVPISRRPAVVRFVVPRVVVVMEPVVAAAAAHHQDGERQDHKGNFV